MPIASTDLIIYGSANMPEDDSSTAGGAISTSTRIIFDSPQLVNSLSDKVKIVSSSAVDVAINLVVTGRDSGGSIVVDTIPLSGTSTVTGVQTFDRILKMVTPAHTGSITVLSNVAGTLIGTLPSGTTTLRRPFYNVVADSAGGSNKVFYEKVFVKNTHATLTLTSAQISHTSGTISDSLTGFAIVSGQNDSGTVTNRLTAPTNVTSFVTTSGSAVYIPPSSGLAAGSGIGVWLEFILNAGTSPQLGLYALQITGNTT